MNIHAKDLLRLFMLSLACYREARGETQRGKRLVAQVIENRVTDPRWPDTYVGVITQPSQLSAFNQDDPNALTFPAEDDPAWAASVAAAQEVLTAVELFTEANHYCVVGLSPAWAREDKIGAREGRHVFYRL